MSMIAVASKCPRCGSSRIYPSRLRSLFERVRRAMTEKQPYRCHKCNHRAWYPIDVPISRHLDESPDQLRTTQQAKPVTAEDLDRLDSR